MILPKPKPKTCRCGCKQKFTPRSSFQTAATPECALRLVAKKKAKDQAIREKRERAEIRARKQAIKPLQYFLKKTERAVNAYIRARDDEQCCISCGTWDTEEWHAGHLRSVGACSSARYDYANVHRQCSECNTHKGGNATEYENRLRIRIGNEEVERIKRLPKSRTWTREELATIEADAKAKLKALE